MARRRPRRKLHLTLAVIGLAVVAIGVQVVRARVERYRAGEGAEGLVDRLARDRPDQAGQLRFVEVGQEAGLDFQHFPLTRAGRLPEDMGSGVAVGDVDGDGWPDLFLVNAGPLEGADEGWGEADVKSRLFRNRGDGTFEDITLASGIDLEVIGLASAFVDVDSDADLDLLLTSYGGVHLLQNDGTGSFLDVTQSAGLGDLDGFFSGIAVGDSDLDGALDLYLCRYVVYDEERASGSSSQFGLEIPAALNPSVFEPAPNVLLRGLGDGTFEDVTLAAGVGNPQGRSLGAVFTDLDDDGWPDIYVANDVSDNALFLNRGDGTFVNRTNEAMVGDYRGAMGLAVADFDGDQDLDLFITHWLAQENALYAVRLGEQDADSTSTPLYLDVADRFGLGFPGLRQVGWGTRLVDLDNDGALDVFVVNGSTVPDTDDPTQLVPQTSQVFWHSTEGRGHYYEVSDDAGAFFSEPHVGRGAATLDFDLDGDEDLVVVLHGERARLLQNQSGEAHASVRVRLRQPDVNRFAIGARLEAHLGDERRMDVTDTQGSYLSQHTVGEVSIGLGTNAQVDRLSVRWPDGTLEEAGPFLGGTLVTWVRGSRPSIEALPGFEEQAAQGPARVEREREFFRLRGEATRARVGGDLNSAVASYREALALWPGHADCLYYLASSLLELGHESEALATYHALVAFQPASSAGWMQVGRIALPGGAPELDDLDLAQAAFARCHAQNSEESGPLVELGLVALLREEYVAARGYLEDAGNLDPRSVRARYLAGRAAWLAGDEPAARAFLEDAHALALASGPGGDSVSSEGDTKSGGAMLADGAVKLDALDGWRTLETRDPDPAREYGPR